jgi:hypothetical protein
MPGEYDAESVRGNTEFTPAVTDDRPVVSIPP